MKTVDTLIHARWIVPVEPDDAVYAHHSLAVSEGRIVDLLPTGEARAAYRGDVEHDLDHHLLIPGLINTHTHAAMSLLRGLADDLPLDQWLNDHIWPAESRWVSEEFVHDGSQLAIAEMLLSGTTCFSDMYFFPEEVATVALGAGIRCQLAFPVIDFPTNWGSGPDAYIRQGTELFDEYKNQPLINIAFGPHAPYTISRAHLERVAMLSEELQAGVQMHVHESAEEVASAVSATGQRPIHMLREIGLLNPRMQCVHATQLQQDDIEHLAGLVVLEH